MKLTNLEVAIRLLKGAERLIREATHSTPSENCGPLILLSHDVLTLRYRTEALADEQRRRVKGVPHGT